MIRPSPNNIVRVVFVLFCCFLGIAVALGYDVALWLGAIGGTLFGVGAAGLDAALGRFSFRGFSHATVGLLVGLFCALLVNQLFDPDRPWISELFSGPYYVYTLIQLAVYLLFGFLGVSLALRSNQEEFSLIIPYVRFRQDSAQDAPILVDTNVIIDGRLPRIYETGFVSGAMVLPRFVLDELQLLADSPDALKRARGRRGLEALNQMRAARSVDVTVHEDYDDREEQVDAKLVQMARRLGARILSNDGNLEKVARLQGVRVLNLNALAVALKPEVSPGDVVELDLVKEGREKDQALAYLADGTMIVVNHARHLLGTKQSVIISSAVQTNAGRLVFADLQPSEGRRAPAVAARQG